MDPKGVHPDVVCAGTTAISGTGRWKYVGKMTEEVGDEEKLLKVILDRNAGHWDASADASRVQRMDLVVYDSHADVNELMELKQHCKLSGTERTARAIFESLKTVKNVKELATYSL